VAAEGRGTGKGHGDSGDEGKVRARETLKVETTIEIEDHRDRDYDKGHVKHVDEHRDGDREQ
jgi:hypothetical protein